MVLSRCVSVLLCPAHAHIVRFVFVHVHELVISSDQCFARARHLRVRFDDRCAGFDRRGRTQSNWSTITSIVSSYVRVFLYCVDDYFAKQCTRYRDFRRVGSFTVVDFAMVVWL